MVYVEQCIAGRQSSRVRGFREWEGRTSGKTEAVHGYADKWKALARRRKKKGGRKKSKRNATALPRRDEEEKVRKDNIHTTNESNTKTNTAHSFAFLYSRCPGTAQKSKVRAVTHAATTRVTHIARPSKSFLT